VTILACLAVILFVVFEFLINDTNCVTASIKSTLCNKKILYDCRQCFYLKSHNYWVIDTPQNVINSSVAYRVGKTVVSNCAKVAQKLCVCVLSKNWMLVEKAGKHLYSPN